MVDGVKRVRDAVVLGQDALRVLAPQGAERLTLGRALLELFDEFALTLDVEFRLAAGTGLGHKPVDAMVAVGVGPVLNKLAAAVELVGNLQRLGTVQRQIGNAVAIALRGIVLLGNQSLEGGQVRGVVERDDHRASVPGATSSHRIAEGAIPTKRLTRLRSNWDAYQIVAIFQASCLQGAEFSKVFESFTRPRGILRC